jgi:hypothetical protein
MASWTISGHAIARAATTRVVPLEVSWARAPSTFPLTMESPSRAVIDGSKRCWDRVSPGGGCHTLNDSTRLSWPHWALMPRDTFASTVSRSIFMSPILTARLLVRRPAPAKWPYSKSTVPWGDTFTHPMSSIMPTSEVGSTQTLRGVPHSTTGSHGMNLGVVPYRA